MINLLNIARMVVSEAEDARYVTEEVRESAKRSMERLGISNLQFIRAQQKVKELGKQLLSFPEPPPETEEA